MLKKKNRYVMINMWNKKTEPREEKTNDKWNKKHKNE